jgi:hypothetical protein
MVIQSLRWFGALALAVGCGSAELISAPLAHGGIAARVAEQGPLFLGETRTIAPPVGRELGKLPAYRVESFGAVELDLDLWGPEATLIVAGPLPGPDGDDPGAPPVVAQATELGHGFGVHMHVALPLSGVYRVVVASREALMGGPLAGRYTLASRCTSGLGCTRPAMSQYSVIRVMRQAGLFGSNAFQNRSESRTLMRGSAPERFRQAVSTAFMSYVFVNAEQAPMLSLRTPLLPSYLDAVDIASPADSAVNGELADLLGKCDLPRPSPQPIALGFAIGNFPDRSLTRCQVAHSTRLASILTSLALHEHDVTPSRVSYRGRAYTAPEALVGALLDNGHAIELLDERVYTQMTALTRGDKDVFWPVWIDTSIAAFNGSTLEVPAGRSQIVWRIDGPDVRAHVMFFLGGDGARFQPKVERLPAWTGRRVAKTTSIPGEITASVHMAASYLRRNQRERTALGAGNRDEQLGGCNDASAAMLRSLWDSSDASLPFPLLRRDESPVRSQLEASAMDVMLGDAIATLPHDAQAVTAPLWSRDASVNRDAVRRTFGMLPHELDSPLLDQFPSVLREQMCWVARESTGRIPPACGLILSGSSVGPLE